MNAFDRRSKAAMVGMLTVALVTVALVVAPAASATASHTRVTRGAAEAIFQTRTTAHQVHLARGIVVSAPRRGFQWGRINPFPWSGDGATYCARDWHVVMISYYGSEGTRRAAEAELARVDTTFELDGQPVVTHRTAIKPFLPTAHQQGFWGYTEGRLLSPGALAVGAHTLVTTLWRDGAVSEVFTLTFFISDGSDGYAACAG